MDLMGWLGFGFAIAALGTASTAVAQIAALKKELVKLKEELRRNLDDRPRT